MTATGRNEDDVAEIDLMAVLHLPHLGRTHQQRSSGSGPFPDIHFEGLNL